jgi:hypothetical protein
VYPVRESTERVAAFLSQKEEALAATFERFLQQDITEVALRRGMDALVECKGELVQRLSDLNEHLLYYLDLLTRVYECYEVRAGKYVARLSKRYNHRLVQGYTQDDFEVMAKLGREQIDAAMRLARKEAEIASVKEGFKDRIESISQPPKREQNGADHD